MAEDLVQRVEKLGFRRKQEFSGPWKVMSALELGILLHIAKNYQHNYYGDLITKTWYTQSVPQEVELVHSHGYTGGVPTRVLLNSIAGLAHSRLMMFTESKPDHRDNVRQYQDLQLDYKVLVDEVIDKLKVSLAVIKQGEEHPIVDPFEPQGERNIMMPVVLVVSADRVVLMEHEQFQGPVKEGFPFVMRVDEKVIDYLQQLLVSHPAEQQRVKTEDYELAKYNMTAVLCNFLVDVLHEGVPSHLTQHHSEVCEAVQRFLQLQSMRGPSPFTGDLQTICNLAYKRHSINGCERVGSGELMRLACGHRYHISCIQHHVRDKAAEILATPRPVFYCPAHQVPLTDRDLHKIAPEFLETLRAKRAGS